MTVSSEYRRRAAEREAFTRLLCRWVVAGLAGAVVLFIATLLVRVAWTIGGAP